MALWYQKVDVSLFIIIFIESFYYLIDPHKIENYGITYDWAVFIQTPISSKKQGIKVLYSTYMDSIRVLYSTYMDSICFSNDLLMSLLNILERVI